jgi:hypothetical protein
MCAKFVASTLSTTTDELCWRETKQGIQYAFENALKTLDDLGREAKRWEQARLVDALCSMAKGQYWSAAARIFEVANAIQEGRLAEGPRRKSLVTNEVMRRGLTHIRIHC